MTHQPADASAPAQSLDGKGSEAPVRVSSTHQRSKSGGRWRLRNWRLRNKVAAVIVVPTLTALILGGLRAQGDLDDAAKLRRTVEQVQVAQDITSLVDELQKERTLAVAWVASGRDGSRSQLDAQAQLVDQAAAKAQRAVEDLDTDQGSRHRYDIGLQRLSVLDELRTTTERTAYPDVAVYSVYSSTLDAIIRLGREVNLTVTDKTLLNEGTVVQTLADVKENVAKENAIMQIAAGKNEFPGDMLGQLRDAQASRAGAIENFRANASPDQLQLYSDTVAGPEVDKRQLIAAQAIASADGAGKKASTDEVDETTGETVETQAAGKKASLDIDKGALTKAGTVTLDRLRDVEAALLKEMRGNAGALATAATSSAVRDATIVLGALLVALFLMALVTLSLLKPMRTLRREALEVAHQRLPATVKRILANPDPAEAAKNAVEPVSISTREETGQVARAFDVVQEQAVLMATEQALLRDNINSIFVNLSRRSQALVERQLSLIDGLELDEQDPDQLSSLFELDHLATRMRRYSESLLVLSGARLSRQFSRPVPASEVVGAAVSEVEQYARVEVGPAPDIAVHGRVVSELVHLVAELLDNATFFSEPDQKVGIRMAITRSRELGIQITDRGVGMSDEEIEVANERLANPPDLDVAVTRRMGLYVVGRLAKRHGIRVWLRANEDIDGGVVARVTVPEELVLPHSATAPRTRRSNTLAPSVRPTALAPSVDQPVAEIGALSNGNGGTGHDDEPGSATWFTRTSAEEAAVESDNGRYGYYWQPGHSEDDLGAGAPTDRLPIYEAVLSQWFTEQSDTEVADAPDDDAQGEPERSDWTSPGDEGWLAAQALLDNSQEATTAAGLPKRVPKARLLPGTATPSPVQAAVGSEVQEQREAALQPAAHGASQHSAVPQPLPVARSAEATRGRMSSFQDGVRRGRHALVESRAGTQHGPESQRDEEQE